MSERVAAVQEELVLEFDVSRPPDELERWWTDLPEVYEADDPREQPHRIELVEETEDGKVYDTTWRGPLGMPFSLTEILRDEGPGRWRFVVPGPGFEIEDRYEVQTKGDGAHLEIRSTVTYENVLGKLARKLMLPRWKQQFTETFSNAVAVFEDERGAEGDGSEAGSSGP